MQLTNMAVKKAIQEAEAVVEQEVKKVIAMLPLNHAREDLNIIASKINEIIAKING